MTDKTQDLWIMNAPVLNLEHLSPAGAAWMREAAQLHRSSVTPFQGGWLAFVETRRMCESWGMPPDLQDVFEWAFCRKFAWLRFDPTGDTVLDLPVFEGEVK